ncbi:MAG: hypothetical protein Q9218_001930 [Villophora microphyllina]
MSTSRTAISPISLPATPLEPTRPPSPIKRTTTVGDSGNFLTVLAAQERRVLELREELQKAEEELLKLKKQWATHEVIKKRNEFRHLEQLQQLRKAARQNFHDAESDGINDRTSFEQRGRSFEGSTDADQEIQQTDGNRPSRQNSKRRRKVFPGSRHTRSLSLLSRVDTTKTLCEQSLHTAPLPAASAGRKKSLSPKRSQQPRRKTTSVHTDRPELVKGEKEVLIETGKQLVGGLREGLWTFFEDIRQATVGEEASSSPNQNSYNSRMQSHQRNGRSHNQHSRSEKSDNVHPGSIPSSTLTVQTSSKQRAVGWGVLDDTPKAQTNHSSQQIPEEPTDSFDEDPWDTWDSPMTTKLATERKESVTSDSVGSSALSTDRSSLRSSMSSVDATPNAAHTDPTAQKQDGIPWPALTKLSPGNLRMTASTLMNEWERSLGQPGRIDSMAESTVDSPTKSCKED